MPSPGVGSDDRNHKGGSVIEFKARVRLKTAVEVGYYHNGGILHTMVRRMLN